MTCYQKGNTRDGLHMANMGGCYLMVRDGFAGMRINENGLSIYPMLLVVSTVHPHLAEEWVWLHGSVVVTMTSRVFGNGQAVITHKSAQNANNFVNTFMMFEFC